MYLLKGNEKIPVLYYRSFIKKGIGFMFQKPKDYGIYFKNCSSIHTFFCFFPLDIYLLDKNNNILYSYKNVKANRIILPKKNVKNVLEIKSGLINECILKDD